MSMDNPTWVTGNLDTSGNVDLGSIAPHLFTPAEPVAVPAEPVIEPTEPVTEPVKPDEDHVEDSKGPGMTNPAEPVEPTPVVPAEPVVVFDPSEHTIPEVLTHLGQSDEVEGARVIAAEKAGRNRKTLLAALSD